MQFASEIIVTKYNLSSTSQIERDDPHQTLSRHNWKGTLLAIWWTQERELYKTITEPPLILKQTQVIFEI